MKLLQRYSSSGAASGGAADTGMDDETEHRGGATSSTTKLASSTSTKRSSTTKRSSLVSVSMPDTLKRKFHDDKVIGLGDGARRVLDPTMEGSKKIRQARYQGGDIPLADDERYARSKVEKRHLVLVLVGYYTALKIFAYYLISFSSIIAIALSVGLTFYWYEKFQADPSGQLSGTGMDWVLLGFAVITPLSLSVGIAFRRRERALVEISKFRSFAYQLFLSHCIWDWGDPPGGKAGADIDWIDHADDVLRELIAIGDELCRFLSLPTSSRSRHRMTKSGRREAARTAEVAYRLYDSFYTTRFITLSKLSERIKLAGLGASEVSRMRQYERFMGDAIENLRMVKTYRTPQTLRSFARLFTTLMPPFFAPTYASLAISLGSLSMGITFAVVTSLCLCALLEGVEVLEDPFVAFVTLDGIDTREEFKVLHWQQLVSARNKIFPEATPYGGDAKFFFTGETLADIESPGTSQSNVAETPLGNASEASRVSRRRRRHHTLPSLGDASLITAGIEDEIGEFNRESGYTICGRAGTRGFDEVSLRSATPPTRAVAMGNSEARQRPSSS